MLHFVFVFVIGTCHVALCFMSVKGKEFNKEERRK